MSDQSEVNKTLDMIDDRSGLVFLRIKHLIISNYEYLLWIQNSKVSASGMI